MSANRYKPHILILPEDDANRQLAVGFALEMNSRQIQVLNEAGGWLNVCESFKNDHVQPMRNCPQRSIVLLIDFDEDAGRRQRIRTDIPADLEDRVFVVGTWSEPEALRRSLAQTYESIGQSIACECRSEQRRFIANDLLIHNLDEFNRVCQSFAAIR